MSDKWKKFTEEQAAEADPSATEVPLDETSSALEYLDQGKLAEQLTAMEEKVAEYADKNLRLLAQLKNTQERAERDISNAHKYGSEKLLGDLLPVLDGLSRGLESSREGSSVDSVREGMRLTLDLLEKTLKKHGVVVIAPAAGEPFNPELHQAMSMQACPDAEPNTIVQTVQQGYSLNGRVLRAAMVIVAAQAG